MGTQRERGMVARGTSGAAATLRSCDGDDARLAGTRVLDVAAGSGESTLMAARRIGPTGYVLAADVSAMRVAATNL